MYKKIISYIYDYEKEEKRENVGFVKLAIQNARYKMKVHIRNSVIGERELSVYGLVHGEQGVDGVLFGKMNIISGTGDGFFQGNIEELNLKQGFSDIHGMLFLGGRERYCVTQWDDEPFYIREFRNHTSSNHVDTREEHERNLIQENILEREKDNSHNVILREETISINNHQNEENKSQENIYLNRNSQEIISKEEKNKGHNSNPKEEENKGHNSNPKEKENQGQSSIHLNEKVNNEISKQEENKEQESVNLNALFGNKENTLQAAQIQECANELEEEEDIWDVFAKRQQEIRQQYKMLKLQQTNVPKTWREGERILESYPKMCPFFENQVTESVRIEPKDIGTFPMEYWYLANNSFLLHGYYCYRHLLFIKMQDEKEVIYAIGIPGNSISRERFMANMFGFSNFMPVKEKGKAGFGYWWKMIWRE